MIKKNGSATPSLYSFRVPGKEGKISCVLYPSSLNKACPVIIFAHGFPGHEKNFALAQLLRKAGFNILIFYYRGCWGSEGVFSFSGSIEDTVDIIDYVLNDTAHNFDKKHIFLLGHSFGAPVIARAIEQRPCIYGGIFLMPYDFGQLYKMSQTEEILKNDLFSLLQEGEEFLTNTSSQEFYNEIKDNPDYYSYFPLANMLSGKHVFWISCKNDSAAPERVHTLPFMELMKKYPRTKIQWHSYDTDHYFSDIQEQLASEIVLFINDSIIEEQSAWIDETIFINKLNDLIAREYKTITSEGAAKYFHISKPYFCALVKNSTGLTFNQLLLNHKTKLATSLLVQTSLPVVTISDQLGYIDAAYCVRVFKKATGITPGEYRKHRD
ncbi:MAG: alpha/beta fold hydrolase [Oscillospiraceae bacterium]|nr:alpha/beta fold hydrolase [Oscillospiraceae bacterium]